jgi:phosphatidylethanolamine/phosphatidyl-N-methylethanolamine N-methyltransferase
MNQPGDVRHVPEDPAWIDYQRRFAEVYDDLNYDRSLRGWAMRAGHRLAERGIEPATHYRHVLEVGAGSGEHAVCVRHGFERYTLLDAHPRVLEIARRRLGADPRFDFVAGDAARLDWPDRHFDRLIATHVLEHIAHPHRVLHEWARVVRDGGLLTVLIPTDPGIAWRLGRELGPRRDALRRGIAYDYVMAREHVNPCHNLVALLRHQFAERREAWWPLPVPAIDLNLFFVVNAVVRHPRSAGNTPA